MSLAAAESGCVIQGENRAHAKGFGIVKEGTTSLAWQGREPRLENQGTLGCNLRLQMWEVHRV